MVGKISNVRGLLNAEVTKSQGAVSAKVVNSLMYGAISMVFLALFSRRIRSVDPMVS